MKYKEYIEKLDKLNDEIEEGLLFDLHEKPPANLHGEIMKSITRERKKVNFFNYRIYAPAVAAVLIFSVVINRPEILEKINFIKKYKFTQEQNLAYSDNTDTKNSSKNRSILSSAALNEANTAVDNSKTQGTNAVSPESSDSDNTEVNGAVQQNKSNQGEQNNSSEQNISTDTKTASNTNTNKSATSSAGNAATAENNDSEENQFNISEYIGMAFFTEPKINYEIVLDTNKSAILNFITENNEQSLSTPNTYKLSPEQFETLDKLLSKYNVHKKTINESETTSKVVKIYFVNYHLVVDNNAPEILKFIDDQGKCVKIDEDTYKISTEDFNKFNKLITSAGIEKELVSEVNVNYVIIKTLIVNYSVSIDANDSNILSFLNDTAKCKAVKNNIYKFSRENFSKFKELLGNSNAEIKVLNETSNQDILITVNNI